MHTESFETKFLKATEYMASGIGSKKRHGFFTHFIRKLKLDFGLTKSIAAVSFQKGDGILLLNPELLKEVTIAEFAAVLVHEVLHVALYHLKAPELRFNPKASNIAMDLEINQIVESMGYPLPFRDRLVTLDSIEKDVGERPPADKDYKFYYEWLYKRACSMMVENHDEWDSDGDEGEAQERIDRELADSYEHSGGEGLGKYSKERLLSRISSQQVRHQAWYRKLRQHMGHVKFSEIFISKSKLNRYNIAGKPVLTTKAHLYIVLDSSGSVSDKEFARFIEHAYQIATRLKLQVTTIHVDTEVNSVQTLEEFVRERKAGRVSRKGYGATCLRPGIDYANSQKDCGKILVLSDGHIGEDSFPEGKTAPILWVFTSKSAKILPNMPGEVVIMET